MLIEYLFYSFQLSDVKYNREAPDGMEITTTCQVMEQKETADGMVDDYCGKEVQDGYAGLCRYIFCPNYSLLSFFDKRCQL